MSRPIACPFCVHRSRSFFRPVQGHRLVQNGNRAPQIEQSQLPCRPVHQQSKCVQSCMYRHDGGPSFPRMRESSRCQKPAPIQRRRMPLKPPECTGIAFKHARTVHSWCVSKTPRHPTRQTTRARTASFPCMRESNRCQKPAPIRCRRMPECPRNAPGLHSNLH